MSAADPMQRDIPAHRIAFGAAEDADVSRAVPVEAPIAIEYGGIGYAVMMGTPADLEDYAIGFSIGEGLIARADEIGAIDIHEIGGGWIARITLPPERLAPVIERARTRVSESSCGLCGIDNIEQVLRPLPLVTARIATDRNAIARALADLPAHQPLSRGTGAVHAAAFCAPDGKILCVREDIGRHNALDKLVGALARRGQSLENGFVVLTARCSYELVEKTVRAGCPMLVTISAPTSLAVERARAAGLTLVSLARADNALMLSDPHGSIA